MHSSPFKKTKFLSKIRLRTLKVTNSSQVSFPVNLIFVVERLILEKLNSPFIVKLHFAF